MKILVEKCFEVWERHMNILHDNPVRGDVKKIEKSNKLVKRYETESEAQRGLDRLYGKYLLQGWLTGDRSTENHIILFQDSNSEIILTTKEVIVSEKIVKEKVRRG